MRLDPQSCYRAVRSRDPRFDGHFFTVRAVVGQQVSVAATRTLLARIVARVGVRRRRRAAFDVTGAGARRALAPVSRLRRDGVVALKEDWMLDPRTIKHLPDDAVWTVVESPIGKLTLVASGSGLHVLAFEQEDERVAALAPRPRAPRDPLLARAAAELREYFAGERTAFSVPVDPRGGTPFQRGVWSQIARIGYGRTSSYGDVAAAVGSPAASRAVGAAAGQNPVAIIVPCHRVVGKDGSLTGFGGGLPTKQYLLDLERRASAR